MEERCRYLLFFIAIVLSTTVGISAQKYKISGTLTIGQPIKGILDPSKRARDSDDRYVADFYEYKGTEGEQLQITVESDGMIPAGASLGRGGREYPQNCDECKQVLFGNGTTATIPADGTYVLTIDSRLWKSDTETAYRPVHYTVTVTRLKAGAPSTASTLPFPEVLDGETRVGVLEPGGSAEWLYNAKAGERLRVRTRSRADLGEYQNEFGPEVQLGTGRGKGFAASSIPPFPIAYTNGADLVIRKDGPITIKVTDRSEKKGGPYSITVERMTLDKVVDSAKINERIWSEAVKDDDGTPISVGLSYLVRITDDYPMIYRVPVKFTGDGRAAVHVIEVQCNERLIQPIAGGLYEGNVKKSGDWYDADYALFKSNQIGGIIAKYICDYAARK